MRSAREVKFVAVGIFNTIFGYLLFSVLRWGFEAPSNNEILTLSFFINTVPAYFLQRVLVFKSANRILPEYLRFVFVNLWTLFLNMALLAVFFRLVDNAYLAQAISLSITVVVSYVAHKVFTFKVQK